MRRWNVGKIIMLWHGSLPRKSQIGTNILSNESNPIKNESPYLAFAFRAENKNLHETNTKNKNTERKRKADFLMPLWQ